MTSVDKVISLFAKYTSTYERTRAMRAYLKFFCIFFTTLFCLIFTGISASAQDTERTELYKATVFYGFDRYSLDLDYRGNRASLESLDRQIEAIGRENIDSVEVISYTSPQGVYEHNLLLARKRLSTIRTVMLKGHPELSDKMSFRSGGEAWTLLRSKIEEDQTLTPEQKQRAIKVIDADVNPGTKQWRMEQLPFYNHILMTHYVELRNACAILVKYHTPEPETAEPEPAKDTTVTISVPEPEPISEATQPEITEPEITEPEPAETEIATVPEKRKVVAAVKTNLLFDAATLVNLGVEFPIGEHFSIAGEAYFPWWQIKSHNITAQLIAGNLEGKYWFGNRTNRERLTGFFTGIYTGAGYYDFQFGNGVQGEFFIMGGLSFGYAHKISEHLRLEYSLGAGYINTTYREYEPAKGTKYGDIKVIVYPWEEKRLTGVLPTKASVSLVWTIGKKGGKK